MKKNEYFRKLFFLQTLKDMVLLESHAYKIEDNKDLYQIAEFLIDKLCKHEKFNEFVQFSLYREDDAELSVKEESCASSGLAI